MNRKIIIIAVVFLFVLILVAIALVFDWGRKAAESPIGNEQKVEVYFPKENQEIRSPIKISGKARGTWFFEASFPIKLKDSSGEVIAISIARAKTDWMTTDFVEFESEMSFEKPTSTKYAILVFQKDNPSGLAENDENISIPVVLR